MAKSVSVEGEKLFQEPIAEWLIQRSNQGLSLASVTIRTICWQSGTMTEKARKTQKLLTIGYFQDLRHPRSAGPLLPMVQTNQAMHASNVYYCVLTFH